jgi:hypothetical protein
MNDYVSYFLDLIIYSTPEATLIPLPISTVGEVWVDDLLYSHICYIDS